MDKIPILDLTAEIEDMWPELETAALRVLKSGHFIGGPEVTAFTDEIATYLGVKHAIPLNSGTDALVIALDAAGIGPGDEVITTAFTFFATAEAISSVGATPVFADIDPNTFNIDSEQIKKKITKATKAVIPVHLFGQAAAMDPVMELAKEHHLFVLEDVAQAFSGKYKGKMLGTIGHAGTYSFFPSKNLGGFGDGGLLATNDDSLAEKSRMLAVHGSKKKYFNELVGYNSRLDAIQAALLRVKLKRIDELTKGRRQVATRYNQMLADVTRISAPYVHEDSHHVYHQYTVRVNDFDRDLLNTKLAESGIDSFVYYPKALHHLPVYSEMRCELPITEEATSCVLSLPIWPSMSEAKQVQVVRAIKNIVES